ncbi:Mut7-C ubiquitin/RNAse domain-containing protein [Pseudomonas sp. gcc21]|uniref:Mut7-C RNAse domain-containing protein n=1 Tax=Pseudomonas sp. gcc21 TaxID=2726989 RepID=UPI0014514BE0|nr:Mut7-C RNAse domain-containing protein [Pseudomonas sp. gcc21]QJD60425.1 Mut7-C ubiquitin/RNAse domain-containing protein [Pseudomonas sp. gcc21]
MTRATFRFYARLNHFLPPDCRGRACEVTCAEQSTIKHMIEALGVPHTEVVLILANGEPAGLGRMLEDGDRIALYPKFETLDVADISVSAERLPGAPRFVADSHLGGLARMLRMAGFDTLYDNHYADAAIVELASAEQRTLLTRDRELLKRRAVAHGCFVHAMKPAAQLKELYERLDLASSARPFTLCMDCNRPLRSIAKQAVLHRLPPRVRERHEHFFTCEQCGRVFWEGTHWQAMRQVLEGLSAHYQSGRRAARE